MSTPNRVRRPIIARLRHQAVLLRRRLDPVRRKQYTLDRLVGPLGHWEELRAYQVGLLKTMGMKPNHRLLDVGCGPLQGGIAIIRYLDPGHYVSIVALAEPLQWAYRLIVEEHLIDRNPRLIMSGTFGAHELQDETFDYVWLSQIMYHLDPTLVGSLFDAMAQRAHPATVAYGDILAPTRDGLQVDSKWRGFTYHVHDLDFLNELASERGMRIDTLGSLADHGYPPTLHRATNTLLRIAWSRKGSGHEDLSDD